MRTLKFGRQVIRFTVGVVGAGVLSAGLLSGCAASPAAPSKVALTDGSAQTETAAEFAITVVDAWVKAAETGMTAGFGVITNHSSQEITLTAAQSTAAANIELHRTVTTGGQAMMQEADGGLSIAPGAQLTLAPGAEHLMFMGLSAPLLPGEEVEITLTFSDGSKVVVVAPVKEFSGANETYAPGDSGGEHSDEDAEHGEGSHSG